MKQEISELLDGELNAAGTVAAIAGASADKNSQRQWQKLCIARAVMRGDYVASADVTHSFADKVASQIAAQSTIIAPNNLLHITTGGQGNIGLKNQASKVTAFPQTTNKAAKLGILAIAASFFAVTLFNLNPFDASNNEVSNPTVARQNQGAVNRAQFLAAEQELQALVAAHGEFSSMAGLNGLAAYAKIVNADGAQ